jgi:CshA-type fibril repeat protein
LDGLSAVAEDIAGNADKKSVTDKELNAIEGVTGARSGVDYTTALQNGNYADKTNPTDEEIQAVIDETNGVLDLVSIADSGDIKFDELKVAGIDDAESLSVAEIAEINELLDSIEPKPSTPNELKTLVDRAKELVVKVASIVTTAKGDDPITNEQLIATGVTSKELTADELKVLKEFVSKANPAPTTTNELKELLDKAKEEAKKIKDLLEKGEGEGNVTEGDLIGVEGIDGPITSEELLVINELIDNANPKPTTPDELVTLITKGLKKAEDSFNEIVEDIAGNKNEISATAEQLNTIVGVEGAREGEDYTSVLQAGNYADKANPTAEEIQAVIDAHNASLDALKAVATLISGGDTPVAPTQLNTIEGVSGAREGVDYTSALLAGGYKDFANPTAEEIQAVIDSYNTLLDRPSSFFGNVTPETTGSTTEETTQSTTEEGTSLAPTYTLAEDSTILIDVLKDKDLENIDIDTLQITGTQNPGDKLFIENQGEWSINEDGQIVFRPIVGFEGNPTPITYTVNNNIGQSMDSEQLTIVRGTTMQSGEDGNKRLELLEDNQEASSIEIVVPENFEGEATLSEDKQTLRVEGEGVWRIDNGTLLFTPEEGFDGTPSDISYIVLAEESVAPATAVAGVSVSSEDASSDSGKESHGVSIFGGLGIFVMMIMGGLFGLFFGRKEK